MYLGIGGIKMKRLFRSEDDRMLAGILGGLGSFFQIDSTIIRLLFVAGAMFTSGGLVILYIIAAFIIPNERDII